MRRTVYLGIIWRLDETLDRLWALDDERSRDRRLRRARHCSSGRSTIALPPLPQRSRPDRPAGTTRPPPVPTQAAARDSSAVQLGTALARAEQDSAADQSALDSLHARSPDTLTPPRTNVSVRGEDVRQEAENLFGADANATFDIDVTKFAGNRRVLEYLEFFQLDSRDRFEIWLSRLGRYEGMIRERLRARRLPED